MYKVMLRDNMSPVAKTILEATGEIEVTVDNDKTTNDPQALAEIIGAYHALGVRSGTRVSGQVLEQAPNLKVIGRAGIGVDNIDIAAATKHGVVVMNAPGGNTVTTAEHTISLIMALARNIPQGTASLRAGKWEKKKLSGIEITGKTLGVLGLGQIGRVVAARARGLKMNVIAADPFVSEEAAKALDVALVTREELFANADFITLHVPGLKETQNLINADTIAQMKPGVRIINCSRGNVVNIDDLYEALSNGHVGGAALDVLPQEPPDPSLPILQHPKVIFTPHLGASTAEAQDKVASMIANQISAYLLGDVIINAVNFPSVSRETMSQLRPYLDLAEKMGAIMGQLSSRTHDLRITYTGNMAQVQTKPLTHAILKGLLSAFTDGPVNYVNAPALAHDKGIHFTETTRQTKDDFAGTIRLKLEGVAQGPDEIWGTVFSKTYPRIVKMGDIYMDAIPEGSMIIIQNIDRPGVIGNVGTLLGKHQINIGRFQLGRLHDRALCMVNVDTPADETVIEELRQLPNILNARQIHLG